MNSLIKDRTWEKTFDAIDDWICIIDLDAKILKSNRTVEKYFNISVQKAIGARCCSLLHNAEQPIEGCPLPAMLRTQKRAATEVQLPDGRWMLVTLDPIFSAELKMTGAVHIARDISHRIAVQEERERLVQELEGAVSKINTLSGLVPICSNCKKIRDDQGYWNLIESYIESHSQVSFSHGICPDCSEKLYGDKPWYVEMKQNKKKE